MGLSSFSALPESDLMDSEDSEDAEDDFLEDGEVGVG